MIKYNKLVELMGGDSKLADKLIFSFKQDAGANLDKMYSYLEDSNFELLSNTSHVLKTQAGYLGLEDIQELCREIEYQSLKNSTKNDLRLMIDKLRTHLEKVISDNKQRG